MKIYEVLTIFPEPARIRIISSSSEAAKAAIARYGHTPLSATEINTTSTEN